MKICPDVDEIGNFNIFKKGNCCIMSPLCKQDHSPITIILTYETPLRVGRTRLPQWARFYFLKGVCHARKIH